MSILARGSGDWLSCCCFVVHAESGNKAIYGKKFTGTALMVLSKVWALFRTSFLPFALESLSVITQRLPQKQSDSDRSMAGSSGLYLFSKSRNFILLTKSFIEISSTIHLLPVGKGLGIERSGPKIV